ASGRSHTHSVGALRTGAPTDACTIPRISSVVTREQGSGFAPGPVTSPRKREAFRRLPPVHALVTRVRSNVAVTNHERHRRMPVPGGSWKQELGASRIGRVARIRPACDVTTPGHETRNMLRLR